MFSFVVECYASAKPVIVTEYFEEYCDEYCGDVASDSVSENMQDYFYPYSIGGNVYSSYSLLSDLEKVYYDKIVSLDVGVLSFTINYSPTLSKKQFESIDFTKIMYAVCLDHPEIFYYNGYGYSKSYYPSTGAVISITYNIGIKKHGQNNAEIYNASNIPTYYDAMMDVIDNANFNTTTRYDFVKSVHDYLCNNASYINDYASCHDAYGTLVNGVAVCQGYSEAFKIFCDKYKIPCVCITGTANGGAHMWNAVQMDDGKWYLLDITWDDQDDDGIFNDFFLIGLETKDTYFTGNAFKVSHVSDGSPYLPPLPYSDTAFNSADKYSNFAATYNAKGDFVNKKIILSFFDTTDNNIYFHGMYVPVPSYYTTATFTLTSGNNNTTESCRMVLIGDCDGDGYANVTDYSLTVNKALSGETVEDDYDEASDANFDGVIDALDVAILERAIVGSNTQIIVE
ncbi:MAG: hypothetical protein IKT55_06560 [Clostridia bacterium]|nr:hypothetical protein [Clostridia bacterium]